MRSTRRGARKFGVGSNVSILVGPRRFRGLRLGVASGLLLAVTPTPEFLDEALEEVEEASRWYEGRSPTAAIGFTDAIGSAVAQIERLPLAWPPYEMDTRRYLLRGFPYFIVYRAGASRIVIIAVAHSSSRPGYWHSRLDDL